MTNSIKLNAQVYYFRCGNCGSEFEAPIYPHGNGSYGEFLLRSENLDELRYLYALNDKTFSEFGEILDVDDHLAGFASSKRTEIFHKTVGYAYDLDSHNNPFHIGFPVACSTCKTACNSDFNESSPPMLKFIEVLPATSFKWQVLNKVEKIDFVKKILKTHS